MSSAPASQEPAPETPTPSAAATASRPVPPWWAWHRRLYDWVMSFAHSRHATPALFAISFTESSFFPIPPDVLQIALTLERRERAWYYAAVSTAASVLGAVLGYLIGWALWTGVDQFFYRYVPGFTPEVFAKVQGWYQRWDFWVVFLAAFTPIPYKVFTIAGGVCRVSMPMFLLASVVGRAGRFFLVAALLYVFGTRIKHLIERYFNLLSLVFGLLLLGGFLLVKVLH